MELADVLSDRFEIEQQIGSGGMGEVFRARDRATGALVAVKVIAGGRESRSARFAREVELLAELSHPGIVRYVAHGETRAGELYLAMEWLDGEDLAARLAREPLTMGEAVKLATRAATALAAAHARGIVHRDLKPSNLFLPGGQIEQVKVLDFGVALREGRTQLTQTGALIGTPGYMAPEQARNQGVIDARADVFSLGCVLFQCLTGALPFEGDSAAATLGKILFGEAPRVSALRADVPEDLDALVAKMMAKDPALRPSDGANLAAALAMLGPLAHSEAIPPRGTAAKPATLIGGEPQFLAVVLLGPAAEGEPALAEAALRHELEPYGGHLELLADGSIMVLLTGDRQMASDHAARAARCALALRALAAGRPIAIAMGRAESSGKLPGGDVIDRASGLLSQAGQGAPGGPPEIALDDMIAGLLDARFDVIEREPGLLLRGERALMQGARTLLGRPTSCVGRDWELGALTAILDDCIEEQKAHVVVVTAMPGVGKSRLGAELVSRIQQRRDEVAIWIGRGDSLRAGSTLDLLAQALRGALGIGGGEPLPERRDQIRASVTQHVPAADQQRVAEFLGELVGTPFPEGEEGSAQLKAARQDAQLMSEQMRNAWLDFLGAETAAHPVLLVLEDLHWSDFGTVRFIDTALRDRADRPWMVLALARPEVFDVFPRLWAERPNVQEIRLKELGKKASERLVRQVLGDTAGPDTIARLVKQADGNMFYLEELIRATAEGKDAALPETVLAMIETRLGRLPIEERRVLRAASVFGEVCWEGGVAALLRQSMGPSQVAEWLARLVDQEMLTVRSQSRFPGERELAFRHALLREGAYATLSEETRQLKHRLAGEWLAQHGEDDPMILAGHLERGGARERAASYYLRAAQQAFHVLDLDAAMTRAALGLGCAPPPELRLALLGIRCEIAVQGVHLYGEAMPGAEELLRLAPRGSTPWAQGISLYLGARSRPAGSKISWRPSRCSGRSTRPPTPWRS
jgi:eukaryotic-like serine/threonine-protein kinase